MKGFDLAKASQTAKLSKALGGRHRAQVLRARQFVRVLVACTCPCRLCCKSRVGRRRRCRKRIHRNQLPRRDGRRTPSSRSGGASERGRAARAAQRVAVHPRECSVANCGTNHCSSVAGRRWRRASRTAGIAIANWPRSTWSCASSSTANRWRKNTSSTRSSNGRRPVGAWQSIADSLELLQSKWRIWRCNLACRGRPSCSRSWASRPVAPPTRTDITERRRHRPVCTQQA